jgi:hypothetical protein
LDSDPFLATDKCVPNIGANNANQEADDEDDNEDFYESKACLSAEVLFIFHV